MSKDLSETLHQQLDELLNFYYSRSALRDQGFGIVDLTLTHMLAIEGQGGEEITLREEYHAEINQAADGEFLVEDLEARAWKEELL